MDQFYLIFSRDKHTEKNIKLSDDNTNNISIIIKTRPFEQKQIYGNCLCSMEHALKNNGFEKIIKDFDAAL